MAYLVSLSIADIECKHAFNRHHVSKNGDSEFHSLVSTYINMESNLLVKKSVDSAIAANASSTSASKALANPKPEPKPGPNTGLSCFRKAEAERKRALSTHTRPLQSEHGQFSKTEWDQSRSNFKILPACLRMEHDAEAKMNVALARSKRKHAATLSKVRAQEPARNETVGVINPSHCKSHGTHALISASGSDETIVNANFLPTCLQSVLQRNCNTTEDLACLVDSLANAEVVKTLEDPDNRPPAVNEAIVKKGLEALRANGKTQNQAFEK